MKDFTFQNPAKIIFGREALSQLAGEVTAWANRVLLVYGGGSIKKIGVYDQVVRQLQEAGVYFKELGGVQPNPRLQKVKEGIALCREEKLGLVLAVGGGSVIDTAKGIAAGYYYDGDVWDFYAHTATPKQSLPVGTVLTIPAAGSEMSFSSVITNEEGMLKRGFNTLCNVPKFSILNPEFTYSLPPYQTASGCADILAHMMERYFTQVDHVDFTDRLLEAGMKTILYNAPIALRCPTDYNARAEIMWASTIAHNRLLDTGRVGDWGSHGIEHELSAKFDIAHGAGLAIVFPSWARYVYREGLAKFVQFAQRVFDVDMAPNRQEEIALEGIRRLEQFFVQLGLPVTLHEAGIGEDAIEEMAHKALPNEEATLGNFKKLHTQDVIAILRMAK